MDGVELQRRLGARIAHARQAAGVTQEALATQLGVTATTVRNWESGRNGPSAENLIRLAKVLRLSIDAFVSDIYDDKEDEWRARISAMMLPASVRRAVRALADKAAGSEWSLLEQKAQGNKRSVNEHLMATATA